MEYNLEIYDTKRTVVGNHRVYMGSFTSPASGTAQMDVGMPIILYRHIHRSADHWVETNGHRTTLNITGLFTGLTGHFYIVGV